VILVDRVKEAALRLNPDLPAKAIDEAMAFVAAWRA